MTLSVHAYEHDLEKFEQLVVEHVRVLRACVAKLINFYCADTVDDIMQEVWYRAYFRLDTVRGNVRNWLLSVAHNMAMTFLRYPPPELLGDRSGDVPTERSAEETYFSTSKDQAPLGQLICSSLTSEQRAVILLVDEQGLSIGEAAEVVDAPYQTVASRRSGAICSTPTMAPCAASAASDLACAASISRLISASLAGEGSSVEAA